MAARQGYAREFNNQDIGHLELHPELRIEESAHGCLPRPDQNHYRRH